MSLPLHANNDLVTIAWLKTVVGDRVANTLPKDNSTWAASGFVVVDTLGGTPNLYVPLRDAVMSVDCFAHNAASQKPPWGKASALAQMIQNACWDHPAIPKRVTLPAGYPPVLVRSAYCTGEPRRVPDDPSSYARYSIPGLVVVWSEVPA